MIRGLGAAWCLALLAGAWLVGCGDEGGSLDVGELPPSDNSAVGEPDPQNNQGQPNNAQLDPENNAQLDPENNAQPDPENNAQPDPDPQNNAQPDPDPDPDPDPSNNSQPDLDPDPSNNSQPDPDPDPSNNSQPDPDPDPDPDGWLREPPPLQPYSHGACPELRYGPTSDEGVNEGFPTGDKVRSFRILVPDNYDGTEPWPVVFAWHWLNASSNSFVREGELESATEQMEFIAVLPDSLKKDNGDEEYTFDWPFAETWGVPGELTFTNDLMACVSEQFNVDRTRFYAIGVSAGALWITYLSTTELGNQFAAFESLSGGLGRVFDVWTMSYAPQPNKFPAIVLWGGDNDWLGLSFSEASMLYRDALMDDDHFVVECVHDSGHGVPPVEPPVEGTTRFYMLWRFMLDHPYGLGPGVSPYQETGLPPEFVDWCRIVTP